MKFSKEKQKIKGFAFKNNSWNPIYNDEKNNRTVNIFLTITGILIIIIIVLLFLLLKGV